MTSPDVVGWSRWLTAFDAMTLAMPSASIPLGAGMTVGGAPDGGCCGSSGSADGGSDDAEEVDSDDGLASGVGDASGDALAADVDGTRPVGRSRRDRAARRSGPRSGLAMIGSEDRAAAAMPTPASTRGSGLSRDRPVRAWWSLAEVGVGSPCARAIEALRIPRSDAPRSLMASARPPRRVRPRRLEQPPNRGNDGVQTWAISTSFRRSKVASASRFAGRPAGGRWLRR